MTAALQLELDPVPVRPGALVFLVPMPPNLANSRLHHMVKAKLKVAYWAALDLIVFSAIEPDDLEMFEWLARYAAKKPKQRADLQCIVNAVARPYRVARPRVPFVRASIRSTMYLGAAMDDGNAMNRHKWIEDWLVRRGFLMDDRKKVLTWEAFPHQIVKRDGNYRIELMLTPSPAAQ